MSKIDDACRNVDGAIACGVIELGTGMPSSIHNFSSSTQTLNEVVAAATMDIIREPNVGRVEPMVRAHRGTPENGDHYFDEIRITSKHNFHFAKTLEWARR